jgi:hypothetical protein
MNRESECGAGRFVDGFAQRRMRMNGGFNFFKRCFQRDCQA